MNANTFMSSIMDKAEKINNEKLIETLNDIEKTWNVINIIASEENYLPVVISDGASKRNRTDVSTMRENLARWNKLNKWIEQEKEFGGKRKNPYLRIYLEERALLDAYAQNTLMLLYESDNTILNYAEMQQRKIDETRRMNRRAGAQKAATKRAKARKIKEEEYEEGRRAVALLNELKHKGLIPA